MSRWKYPLSSSDPAVVEKSMAECGLAAKREGIGISCRPARPSRGEPTDSYRCVDALATADPNATTMAEREGRDHDRGSEEPIFTEPTGDSELHRQLSEPSFTWFDVGNVVIVGYPQD